MRVKLSPTFSWIWESDSRDQRSDLPGPFKNFFPVARGGESQEVEECWLKESETSHLQRR